MHHLTQDRPRRQLTGFILYASGILTVAMLLFPPFATVSGTEYAFLLTGPLWATGLGSLGESLGMTASINWPALIVQLFMLWSLTLGIVYFFGASTASRLRIGPALAIGVFSMSIVPFATAQTEQGETPAFEQTVGIQGGKFGVGFASSWPTYGVSGTMQVSETLTLEAVAGFLGTFSNFGGRVWYRFNRNPDYDLFAYGSASLFQYRYTQFNFSNGSTSRATESVPGLGAGVGIELGLGRLFGGDNFPPLFWTAEIGLSYAGFDHYDYSSFVYGGGLRYRFGGR
jgi:hypothetical protein